METEVLPDDEESSDPATLEDEERIADGVDDNDEESVASNELDEDQVAGQDNPEQPGGSEQSNTSTATATAATDVQVYNKATNGKIILNLTCILSGGEPVIYLNARQELHNQVSVILIEKLTLSPELEAELILIWEDATQKLSAERAKVAIKPSLTPSTSASAISTSSSNARTTSTSSASGTTNSIRTRNTSNQKKPSPSPTVATSDQSSQIPLGGLFDLL